MHLWLLWNLEPLSKITSHSFKQPLRQQDLLHCKWFWFLEMNNSRCEPSPLNKLRMAFLVHDDFIEISLWGKALQDYGVNQAQRPNGLLITVVLLVTPVLTKVGSQMRTAKVLSWEQANAPVTSIPSLLVKNTRWHSSSKASEGPAGFTLPAVLASAPPLHGHSSLLRQQPLLFLISIAPSF